MRKMRRIFQESSFEGRGLLGRVVLQLMKLTTILEIHTSSSTKFSIGDL